MPLLASARTPETASYFERDEAMLVDKAAKLSYRSFARSLAYWEQLADPDGAERSAERRTPAQRRADALVEMARRAAATPAGSRLPEPLFSVLVGYETFAGRTCELANGTVVSPGSLVPWLDRAWALLRPGGRGL